MPGFTAEASLSGSGPYYVPRRAAAEASGGALVPQFSWCYYTDTTPAIKRCCYCDEFGGGCVCRNAKPPLTLFPPRNP